MPDRSARIVYRVLESWPYEPAPQVDTPFSAPWAQTVDLLLREADFLRADLVVVELDIPGRAVRKDEQLRSDARAYSEKVRISMQTSRGPMSWHTDRYVLPRGGSLGWRENVRAIALTLEALRTVERYGAVHGSEQYRGFLAIEAAPSSTGFASPEAALRWMQERGDTDGAAGRTAYRALARVMHPDAGGDPAEWDQLRQARALVEGTDLW